MTQQPYDLSAEALLAIAEFLAKPHFKGVEKQAQIRRAISTAYYAAFHALLRSAADAIIETKNRKSPFYEEFYRSVDHSQVRAVCNQIKSDGVSWAKRVGQVSPSVGLSQIAAYFLTLLSAREHADYQPSSRYAWIEAAAMVETSRALIDSLTKLEPDELRKFLLACTLKDRKR